MKNELIERVEELRTELSDKDKEIARLREEAIKWKIAFHKEVLKESEGDNISNDRTKDVNVRGISE